MMVVFALYMQNLLTFFNNTLVSFAIKKKLNKNSNDYVEPII